MKKNRRARRAALSLGSGAGASAPPVAPISVFSNAPPPPTPAVRDPDMLEEKLSPHPTISQWIAQMVQGELTWGSLDAIRKNAEMGMTEGWADLSRRMYKSDDQIFSTMTTYIAAIAGSRRELVPRKGVPPEYAEIAADQARLCEEMLNSLPNVERSFGELLDADFVGWAVQEIMWKPKGEWLWPTSLEWLHPDRFRFSQRFVPYLYDKGAAATRAREIGITTAEVDGLGLPLPQNKYVVHIPRLIPDYPMGSGILLACMRPWWVKNWCTKFALAGAELAGIPRMLGKLPQHECSDAVREELYLALQMMGTEAVGITSGETSIEILDPKMQGNGSVWDYLLKRCDAAITKAILGSTLNVEVGDTGGNRSLGESQADMTIAPRWSRSALLLANSIETQLLRPFLEINRHVWGGHVFVPQLLLHITEDEPTVDQLSVDGGVVTVDELRRSRKLAPWGKEKGGDAIVRIAAAPAAFTASMPSEASATEVAALPPFAATGPIPIAAARRRPTENPHVLTLSRRLCANRVR